MDEGPIGDRDLDPAPSDDGSAAQQGSANAVRVDGEFAIRLSLADLQNAIPLVRDLVVVNDSDVDLPQLMLRLAAEPAFMKPREWHIDLLRAGQHLRLSDVAIKLDGPLFQRLTEAEPATLTATLVRRAAAGSGEIDSAASSPDDVLARADFSIELLARDQWGGVRAMPEMLAAFVQPNDPYVEYLLRQAADVLHEAGQSTALAGYSDDPKRAWSIASALWTTIGREAIVYALPPASFEQLGQKVRGPSRIAEARLATCLDSSLLFAAALEQAGLNPILVLTQGHAFVGVWLKKEAFHTAVVDDVTALRKRIKLQELLVFETTLVTQTPTPGFPFAIAKAREQLAEQNGDGFELCIDVARARLQRIRPLAGGRAGAASGDDAGPGGSQESERGGGSGGAGRAGGAGAGGKMALPGAGDFDASPDPEIQQASHGAGRPANETPEGRLARWQRKLLDLSLRNNLLNFKSRKALHLDAPDPGRLEDLLVAGKAIKLLPRQDLMEGRDLRSRAIHDEREQEDSLRERALGALEQHQAFLRLEDGALNAALLDLYRTSRSTLQEGGSNTLYLAFGFLSWRRDAKDDKRYKAPLLMLPVSLERRSALSGFSLKIHDDAPQFNPTLLEMLRQDFQLKLSVNGSELVQDGALDVTGLLRQVSQDIRDIAGWEVLDEVVLATFSFAKYLMWKDLKDRSEQLKQSAVVRHLIDTPRDSYPSRIPFPEPRRLDAERPPEQTFCPLPYDSSQLAAVVSGASGKDFVLIGPPGTGKSQTIANLIAQCLAERKRVLFVSEKMAALDVVYRRLREVGLGEFCLELHSSKARKAEVLAQLKSTWAAQGSVDPDAWKARAEQLGSLRASLNGYVERLHRRHGNGLSVYEAIGQVTRHPDSPKLDLRWPTADTHDQPGLSALRELADQLDLHLKALEGIDPRANALAHIRRSEWSPSWARELGRAGIALETAATTLAGSIAGFMAQAGLPPVALERRRRKALQDLAGLLLRAGGRNWRFMVQPSVSATLAALNQGSALVARHRALDQGLPQPWPKLVINDVRKGIQLIQNIRTLRSRLSAPWPAAVCDQVEKAAEALSQYREHRQQLSQPYQPEALRLDLRRLQKDWAAAQSGIWPFKALKRRSVEKTLAAVADDEVRSDALATDLKHLAQMKACRGRLGAAQELGLATGGLWEDDRTDLNRLLAARRCQLALAQAMSGQLWDDSGLELVAAGACGQTMAEDLKQMRALRGLEAELKRLDPLRVATDGLWCATDTDIEVAAALASLNSAVHATRDGQAWADDGLAVIDDSRAGLQAAGTLQTLRELRGVKDQLSAVGQVLTPELDGLWQGLATNLDEVKLALMSCEPLRAAIVTLGPDAELASALMAVISRLLGEQNALLQQDGAVAMAARQLIADTQPFEQALTDYVGRWHSGEGEPPERLNHAPADIAAHCQAFARLLPRLNQWCGWLKVRDAAVSRGLTNLVAAMEEARIELGRVRHAFEVDYCRWWLEAAVDGDEVLRTFLSAQHEKRIRDFRELGRQFNELSRQWVRAQLCADLPSEGSVSRSSEWGTLKHEMQKKARHLPLRELMGRAPTAISALTPCLLMSPLSVAQYLPANAALFDVVVFDEASQIPVWDAVGAMARGRQVIMVGDPKQLPPTNFFGKAEAGDEDSDVEEDLESILDECLGANIPTISLNWHYRSRHESLIAFSNRHYYDNGLVTFPSPVTNDQAVTFHLVPDSLYEKGGNRHNPTEARALVADLVGRLKSPGFRQSGRTVGVVTFNMQQQQLIEDLLDEARRKDPDLEHFFDESLLEPVFVKNLENVQGDERDIMYFSLTFGPTAAGTVSMNFGALNRQGGERRLNVAVTRARHELRVFSSLRPEQLDLSRTSATGVHHLKYFMEFAQRGPRAFAEAVVGSVGGFESPFEEAVSMALSQRGWTVHPQVGVSGYRIDLGVVDEDAPGRYLAGVECDGATYHRSATARDRDELREQVLRGLGWDIVRIWSPDWWADAAGTADRVDRELRRLLEVSRQKRAAEEAALSRSDGDGRGDASEGGDAPSHEPAVVVSGGATDGRDGTRGEATVASGDAGRSGEGEREIASEGRYARDLGQGSQVGGRIFVEVDMTTSGIEPQPDRFFDSEYDEVLAALIDHAVRREGPIKESVLARRIARAHGWVRTGARIQERVLSVARRRQRHEGDGDERCFWPAGMDAGRCEFRRPAAGGARELDEVPRAELMALARELEAGGLEKEEGVEAMIRALGMRRARAGTREVLGVVWGEGVRDVRDLGWRP